MLVEVTCLEATRKRVVPILESQGYDDFWQSTQGDDQPPFYAWFIKRDGPGVHSRHIHMVASHFEHWSRLLFRDYLIAHPAVAADYHTLKLRSAREYRQDRAAYTNGKTPFITNVMRLIQER